MMVSSVVLADDTLEHCFFFRKALKEIAPDIQYTEVYDGEKLINLLEGYLPDLLFMELSMPCKNGMQCIREIRENRSYDLMPIIVFSINSKPNAIQNAYSLGADLYIIKPGEYSALASCLEKVLSMDWKNKKNVTKQFLANNTYQPFKYSPV